MAKSQGTRLSDTWQPAGKSLQHAEAMGLEPHQIGWLRNGFVRYFTGPDATKPVKKDWHRAWVNWVERDLWKARKVTKDEIKEAHKDQPDPFSIWRARMNGWKRSAGNFWPASAGPKPDEKGTYVPVQVLKEFGLA